MPILDFPKVEKPTHRSFHVSVAITDKLLMLILDLEKVQISRSKQQQFSQLFLDLFGSPDQELINY